MVSVERERRGRRERESGKTERERGRGREGGREDQSSELMCLTTSPLKPSISEKTTRALNDSPGEGK